MAKYDAKTKETEIDPKDYVASVEHNTRRADAEVLLDLFAKVTGKRPKMWGPSLIGYGKYHYKYDSGHEGDMLATGFSPRKSNLVLYIMPGYEDLTDELSRLGKHKMGKSCLYVNKLADVDMDVLEEIIVRGWKTMHERYEVTD